MRKIIKKIRDRFGLKKFKKQVSRAPRVFSKQATEHVVFLLKGGSDERPVGVHNLSVTGMALERSDLENSPSLGSVIQGILKVGECECSITASVVRSDIASIGVRFLTDRVLIDKALRTSFTIELCADRMHVVSSKYLKQLPKGQTQLLLMGQEGAEIYVVSESDRLISFHLSFLGHYFEKQNNGVLKYGQIEIEYGDVSEKSRHPDSRIINWIHPWVPESVDQARRFVKAAPGVSSQLKEKLLEALKE